MQPAERLHSLLGLTGTLDVLSSVYMFDSIASSADGLAE
jgi:hypothetical protein